MTKLQLLHRALNERLMAAVEQIMEMVGGTVLEYEEETVRARKENEILRRRLRWMEGENPTDWPDPTDFSVTGETSLTDTLAIESLIIKTEPIDSHDFQLYGPETSFPASVCTASMGMVYPGTSAPADAGIPDGIVWDSAQSYMAPLDFDPTLSTMARNRSQRRSFACPDCGKVFGREQRLMFHMRVHSTERPYTYRRRKACFYGDKKQKKKLRGLSKTSRQFIEDLSDTSEQTEQSAGSAHVGTSTSAGPSAPELEPSEASDEASEHTSSSSSSKLSETSSSKPVGLKTKQGREKPKTAQCLQCNKAFTNVSRLAVHMKTHTKPVSSQDEQNVQGDTDRADSRSQNLPKVIRNNETEVEKAKAIGQRLFQCPECNKIFARSCWLTFHLKSHERERKRQKKKQLQNNKLKDVPKVLEKPKKPVATDSSKVHVLKKIFACPYCDKVFAREGWLGPHIRGHTTKKQKSDIISDAILPTSTKRRTRRVMTKKNFTEQSFGKTENSDVLNEKTINETSMSQNIIMELRTNPETKIIITNNSEDTSNESKSISKETETLTNKKTEESKPVPEESTPVLDKSTPVPKESTLVLKESTPVAEESSGQKRGDKKAKKRFPCRECGKVYLLAGWLKTHKKMHKKERILEENRRQLMMMKEFGQNNNKEAGQSLVETDVKKKQKKKKKTLGLQGSLDDKKKKKKQLTNAVLLEAMDKSSDVQTATDKSKESGGATPGQCVCKDCGKVYARKNWLSLHMLGHRKALMALPQKANDETPKSDSQMTQEGSSTEESKGQKGKDSGKATFPCPFCDKVFPRAMRLMVHMQIHSGEKPYSYRQRKEQFYTEPTRSRVPETEKQEPAIEGNDEKRKDEGNDVTRSQTSQDHASTTELLETIQPQSVTGRKFSLLPLQSSDAATIQSTALTTSESKSDTNFSLQPRIVLDPFTAEASHSPSSEGGDFKTVIVETSDIQLHQMPDLETCYAATGEQVKSHFPQTPHKNSNLHTSHTRLAETDDPDIVCVTVGSADTFYENTSCSEMMLVSIAEQLSSKSQECNKSEICKKKSPVGPQLLEMNIESQQSGSQINTHGKSRFLGIGKANNIPPHSEYLKFSIDGVCTSDQNSTDKASTADPEYESSSSAVQQVAHTESGYMVLSDVSDDDERADVSDNSDKKKEIKISTPLLEGSADAWAVPSFSYKASDSDSNVTILLEKTDEQNVPDGTLANRDELADIFVQQPEEPSSTGQKRWFSCLACGLTFASEASLTQHMKVHSVSAGTYQNSNTFKALKKRVKNNETKPKQAVQTSGVGSADSKDNSEISGNSDPTLRNVRTAKFSGSFPDFGAASQSSRAYSNTVDRKLKKEKETPCCCYCRKPCEKLELHLMHDHPKEPKVIEALHCSNTVEERKRLLRLLCSNKELKTSRNKKDGDLVHCIFCQGYYRRNHFWNHALICEQKQSEEFTETEPRSSIDPANASLRSRPSLAQKSFHQESGNFNKVVFCHTVRQTIPESIKLTSAKAEHHTTQYLDSVSTVSETGSTEVNPDTGSGSLPILYTGNSSAMMSLESESSGPLIPDSSCSSTVQKAFANMQKLTLRAKGNLEKEHQSTTEPENKLNNILQPHTSVSSSSYLLDTASINLHQDTDQDCQSSYTQALDCSGKPVTPQESMSHIHTGSNDTQLTANVKSDWTTIPTVHMDLEQHLSSDKEPNRTTIMMTELRSESSAQSNPHSESTGCLVAKLSSSKAQDIVNPGTATISIPLFKQFDSGHIRDDTGEGSTCTGKDIDIKPPGINSTVTIQRRWDSGSRDTKRRRQSDPLQTSAEERKASAVTSQTPEMKCSLQTSNTWNSLKNSKGKAQIKLKKKHYCLYCKNCSHRMAQHLLSAHAKEPEVAKALSYDKKSKERKLLLDLLQSKGNLLHKGVGIITLSEELPAANQASLPDPDGLCSAKQENPNPESVGGHVSDTSHSAAQLYADTQSAASPCKDSASVGQQLLSNLESQSNLTTDTSLVKNDRSNKNTTCNSPVDDQSETGKSVEKKTDAEQNSQKLHKLEDRRRRRSSRIQARPIRLKYNPSDEAECISPSSKPHACQHCSASFCRPYNLRRHLYIHTSERPFWCSECDMGFIQKYRYRNHRMIHHGERQSCNYKEPSRRFQKRSHSGEKFVENELNQQQLVDSTVATCEPSSSAEERPVLTDRDPEDLREFHAE